jgi:hypothetical protein
MNSISGVITWMTLYSAYQSISGRNCYPDGTGPKPFVKNTYRDLNTDMLFGVAELLRNETAGNILHSIKLLKSTQKIPAKLPIDGKSYH